ncbi:MAG TPA: LysE family translocator [Thermomicrobiales bacterium]|nr:LysE family translocator [Thermomicrobiales bacterium]
MNENVLSLVLFAVAMTVSPGSNNVLLASSGVQVGMRRSVTLGLGIVVGIVVLLSVAALGLGTLVHEHPSLRTAMQAIGSAYLVWLGWKIAQAGAPDLSHAGRGSRKGFLAGFINTMLNPKGWTMALSAAAGYTALAPSAPRLALVLSLVFIAVFVPNWVLWTGGGQAIGRSVQGDDHRRWVVVNRILGLLVVVSIVPMWLE